MRVAFVRTGEQRERVYVTRPDGTTVTFHPSTYGPVLHHDLVHLCVERALGIRHGFWGLLADGVDFDDLASPEEYARTRRKVRGMVDRDVAELRLAEAAVLALDDDEAVAAAYADAGIEPPADLAERLARARADCADLAARWAALEPGDHVVEEFPVTP